MDSGDYEKLVKAAERENRIGRFGCGGTFFVSLLLSVIVCNLTTEWLRFWLVVGIWLLLAPATFACFFRDKAFKRLQKASYEMVRQGEVGQNELECMRIRLASATQRGFRVKPGRRFVLKMMDLMEPAAQEKFRKEWDERTALMMAGRERH